MPLTVLAEMSARILIPKLTCDALVTGVQHLQRSYTMRLRSKGGGAGISSLPNAFLIFYVLTYFSFVEPLLCWVLDFLLAN